MKIILWPRKLCWSGFAIFMSRQAGMGFSSLKIPNFFKTQILTIFWRASSFTLCFFAFFYKENFILEVFCLLSWAISLKSVSLTSVRPTSYAKRDCEYTKQLCEHCHHKQKYHLNCSLQPQHDHCFDNVKVVLNFELFCGIFSTSWLDFRRNVSKS